jgi:hypothetical protein
MTRLAELTESLPKARAGVDRRSGRSPRIRYFLPMRTFLDGALQEYFNVPRLSANTAATD